MEYLNRSELAKVFKVSLTTIDAWLRRGMPYVEKDGKRWKFELPEVIEWRGKQFDIWRSPEPGGNNVSLDDLKKQGFTGNLIRDYSTLTVQHFFWWLVENLGTAWSGMMSHAGIDDKLIEKLYVFTYMLMKYNSEFYCKKDIFNESLMEQGAGGDFDNLWSVINRKPLIETEPIQKSFFPLPSVIEQLLKSDEIYEAAKNFHKG